MGQGRSVADCRREKPGHEIAGARHRFRELCPTLPISRNRTTLAIPMKLAFSSNAYLRFSVEETIAADRRPGLPGLELLADVPHAWPAGLLRGAEAGDPRLPRAGTAWRSPTSTAS